MTGGNPPSIAASCYHPPRRNQEDAMDRKRRDFLSATAAAVTLSAALPAKFANAAEACARNERPCAGRAAGSAIRSCRRVLRRAHGNQSHRNHQSARARTRGAKSDSERRLRLHLQRGRRRMDQARKRSGVQARHHRAALFDRLQGRGPLDHPPRLENFHAGDGFRDGRARHGARNR